MKKKIGLGTWSWGNKLLWNYQQASNDNLRQAYKSALDAGFWLIDTADSYGTGTLSGQSERLLGIFLEETSEFQKRNIKIATKLAPYPWRLGRQGFNQAFLRSFERLNKNLDIVQLHWSTARYNPIQELQLLDNLCDLIDKGYKFKIGLSNIGPKRLNYLNHYLAKKGQRVYSVQVQFSLLAPDLQKQRLVRDICKENNINFLAYSPLSFGLLSKKQFNFNDKSNSILRNLIFKYYSNSIIELRNIIEEIAISRSVSMAQVAINWCCYQGAIPIVGLRNKTQVQDIAKVFKWNLNLDEFQILEKASLNCSKRMLSNPFSSN
tara:strand:+ start:5366 stop:6328 length:963 start_codon:yes stop_codon:yes gene_type:complete